MSRCVIRAVTDGETGRTGLACMAHCCYAPCIRDGEPADPTPVHCDESPSRVAAIEYARKRVAGSRPIVVHNGTWVADQNPPHDVSAESGVLCWCNPFTIPAG